MKNSALLILTAAWVLLAAGCRTPAPEPSGPPAVAVHFATNGLTFRHPETGDLFRLHPGRHLPDRTEGVTPVPSNIPNGVRDATSSFYEIVPRDGSPRTGAAAESSYVRDDASRIVRNTQIQSQPDGDHLLISENTSDGLPRRRYILFTKIAPGRYRVSYLAPPYKPVFTMEHPSQPPDITLLPGGKAEVEGRTMNLEDIEQSPDPFGLGG